MAEVLKSQAISSVAIIGGGLAGLSAAAQLAEQGISATLFEASPQLGGRARRVIWKNTHLDNGQHILLGAYHHTLQLLRLIKVDEKSALLRMPLTLHMSKIMSLKAYRYLPVPFHLLFGLFTATGLNWHEKWAAISFFTKLKLGGFRVAQDKPLASFLALKKQPQKLIQVLWEPLCLAALNTPLHQASTQIFLNVLRDSFNKKRSDSDLLLPKIDLSALFADAIAVFAQERGIQIKLKQVIKKIEPAQDSFKLINEAKDEFHFSYVIVATSPFRTNELDLALKLPKSNFSYQPIYTVYLQYPTGTKLPRVMTGLCNTLSQWAFDRGQLCGQAGLIAVIISAEGTHQNLTQQELAERVIVEMKQAFTNLPEPIWHKVIAEKRATFTCKPNLQRPLMQTQWPGLYLAGDYVASDYPATIEGAIHSGMACAKHIAEQIFPKT
jgi:squalene-associated FAD-dependent desaturase